MCDHSDAVAEDRNAAKRDPNGPRRAARRVPTPSASMIVALTALAVALSGTGYAALTLPKNSVTEEAIRANAVTSTKVKNGALTGVDVKDGSLRAADLDPGVLAVVPRATVADTATKATTADTAARAVTADTAAKATTADTAVDSQATGGVEIKTISYRGIPDKTVLDVGGLNLQAACGAGTLFVRTNVDNARVHISTIEIRATPLVKTGRDPDFDISDGALSTDGVVVPHHATIDYEQPGRARVLAEVQFESDAGTCFASGYALVSKQ